MQMGNCKISEPRSDAVIVAEKIASMPKLLARLKVGQTGLIIMHAQLAQGEYNVTLVPENLMSDFESLLGNLKEACEALLAENPQFRYRMALSYFAELSDFVSGIYFALFARQITGVRYKQD